MMWPPEKMSGFASAFRETIECNVAVVKLLRNKSYVFCVANSAEYRVERNRKNLLTLNKRL